MNNLTLKSCVFNNFMSYGNNVNEFTFPRGVILMTADNGSGKSTVIEAISYALFGESYRGGNKGDLRNTRNTEGTLRVMLEFDCERVPGEVESYRVTRTIAPKGSGRFDVDKFEGERWVPQNKRAGYAQRDFEENILGFNMVLFKNTISMNTQESIPFMEMKTAARRELLESIIMCNHKPWKEETTRRASAAAMAFDLAANDIERFNGERGRLVDLLKTMKEEQVTAIENLKADIQQRKESLGTIAERIQTRRNGCATIEQGITAKLNEIASLRTQLDNAKVASAAAKTKFDSANAELAQKAAVVQSYADECNKETGIDNEIRSIQNACAEINILAQYQQQLTAAEAKYSEALAEYEKLGVASLNTTVANLKAAIDGMTSQIHSYETRRSVLASEIKRWGDERERVKQEGLSLVPGKLCPTCGKPYTKEDMEPHKVELRRQWTELNKKVEACQTEDKDIELKIADLLLERARQEAELAKVNEALDAAAKYNEAYVAPAKAAVDNFNRSIAASEKKISDTGINPAEFSSRLNALNAEKARLQEVRAKWQASSADYQTASQGVATIQFEYNNAVNAETNLGSKIALEEKSVENDRKSLDVEQQRIQDDEQEIVRINESIAKDEATVAAGVTKESAAGMAKVEQQIKDVDDSIADAELRKHEASDDKLAYDYIGKDMFADDGLKEMIFSQFVPEFNKSVEMNIRKMNLPYTVIFNTDMSFQYQAEPGYAPTYDMLSQGQKRKLGFAILMAFRDFVSLVGNFRINFLSMDEVLDISTDDAGMRDMLDIVRDMNEDIGCTLVITHRGSVVADKFDYRIVVQNDGMYSTLGELEKL